MSNAVAEPTAPAPTTVILRRMFFHDLQKCVTIIHEPLYQ
jgi:hypothetical protein